MPIDALSPPLPSLDLSPPAPSSRSGRQDESSAPINVHKSYSLESVGPFNLDSRRGLRAAVRARAPRGEIATFTSNVKGLSAAANMALQLRRLHIEHHMVLADARDTCVQGYARWAWLGCGWSVGLPGFEAKYATGWGKETTKLWSLWSAKWLLVARLVELRVNVLALDTDMMMQSDPYPLLTSPPVSRFEMVIVPEGSRVNLGFLYVRGKRCQPAGGVASVLWDVVRRLRLFTEDWPLLDRRGKHPSTAGLWDQGLFTDAITSAVEGALLYPYTYLQSPRTGIWQALHWPSPNASVASLAAMHSVRWRDPGDRRLERAWLAEEATRYGVAPTAKRPAEFLPPRGHPQRTQWEGLPIGLLWVPLQVLDPVAHLQRRAPSAVTPGWLNAAVRPSLRSSPWPVDGKSGSVGSGRGVVASGGGMPKSGGGGGGGSVGGSGVGRTELLLATPDWLYCLVGRWAITAGWPSLAPRSVCAVLHLVECRSQFGAWDASKAARPYVQRALGYWLLPEPQPQLPPQPPAEAAAEAAAPPPRAVRLSPRELLAASESRSVGALLNALHRLAIYAAVTGRTPVVPSVPCGSRWLQRNPFGRRGVADDYVIQVAHRIQGGYHRNETDGGVECHLSMGGKQCLLPTVLPAWTRPASGALGFLSDAAPEAASAPRVSASFAAAAWISRSRSRSAAAGGASSADHGSEGGGGCMRGRRLVLDVRALRSAARREASAPMLEVGTELHADSASPNPLEGQALRLRCRGSDRIDETQLLAEERHRLDGLRAACPAFFGERGAKAGQLDWIHRKRLAARRMRPQK